MGSSSSVDGSHRGQEIYDKAFLALSPDRARGPKRWLYEAGKGKPGWLRRSQTFRYARAVGFLPNSWTQGVEPAQGIEVQSAKLEEYSCLSPLISNMELLNPYFCSVGFWSCFGRVFPHYNSTSQFRNDNIYSVLLDFASM